MSCIGTTLLTLWMPVCFKTSLHKSVDDEKNIFEKSKLSCYNINNYNNNISKVNHFMVMTKENSIEQRWEKRNLKFSSNQSHPDK